MTTAFSEALRRERVRRGENQRQTAARFGVSQPSYFRWETGDTLPRDQHWSQVAGFLGMSVDDLYFLIHDEEPPSSHTNLDERMSALERDIVDIKEQFDQLIRVVKKHVEGVGDA